jgi:hypothetical protein
MRSQTERNNNRRKDKMKKTAILITMTILASIALVGGISCGKKSSSADAASDAAADTTKDGGTDSTADTSGTSDASSEMASDGGSGA